MIRCDVIYVGSATLLLDIGGIRLLTDPALDPAGSEYGCGSMASGRSASASGSAQP
jgi:L-ascorbate metabolism protein UlaG (beta-lactamase superfamily)